MTPAEAALLMFPGEAPELEDLVNRPSWQERAACHGQDRQIFFSRQREPTTAAKVLCSACVVRAACLSYALSEPELVGVWGGTSARERRRIRQGDLAISEVLERVVAGEVVTRSSMAPLVARAALPLDCLACDAPLVGAARHGLCDACRQRYRRLPLPHPALAEWIDAERERRFLPALGQVSA